MAHKQKRRPEGRFFVVSLARKVHMDNTSIILLTFIYTVWYYGDVGAFLQEDPLSYASFFMEISRQLYRGLPLSYTFGQWRSFSLYNISEQFTPTINSLLMCQHTNVGAEKSRYPKCHTTELPYAFRVVARVPLYLKYRRETSSKKSPSRHGKVLLLVAAKSSTHTLAGN